MTNQSRVRNVAGTEDVVLKDFDGIRTIYPAEMPLPEIIRTSDESEGILMIRHYVRSEQRDEAGRLIYFQKA